MGRSIAGGMMRAGVVTPENLTVVDRVAATAEAIARDLGIVTSAENVSAHSNADIILLCVKPKDVAVALMQLTTRNALAHQPLIISIAAGISTAMIEEMLPNNVPVVRAMPNTPCLIGKGMTVVTKGGLATDTHLAVAHEIFSTLGRCITLDEKHFDAVTAVSASGPAFIYVVLEALADGGVGCGLPRTIATELAAQMTLGAAEMLLTTGRHPASLKDDVTTPGGCTISGLLTLEDGRIRSVLARTIEATARRAGELGR
jgi:pyrroline-5-carboxylate reductase